MACQQHSTQLILPETLWASRPRICLVSSPSRVTALSLPLGLPHHPVPLADLALPLLCRHSLCPRPPQASLALHTQRPRTMHQLPPVPTYTFRTELLGPLSLLFYGLVYGSSIPPLGKTQTKTRDFFNPLFLCCPRAINHPSPTSKRAPSRTIRSLSIAPILPQVWDGGGFSAAPQPYHVVLHRAGEGSCEDDKAAPLKSGEVCVLTT